MTFDAFIGIGGTPNFDQKSFGRGLLPLNKVAIYELHSSLFSFIDTAPTTTNIHDSIKALVYPHSIQFFVLYS